MSLLLLFLVILYSTLALTLPVTPDLPSADTGIKLQAMCTAICAQLLTVTLGVWVADRFTTSETPFAAGAVIVGIGVAALGAVCTSFRSTDVDGLPQRIAVAVPPVTVALAGLATIGVLRFVTLPSKACKSA